MAIGNAVSLQVISHDCCSDHLSCPPSLGVISGVQSSELMGMNDETHSATISPRSRTWTFPGHCTCHAGDQNDNPTAMGSPSKVSQFSGTAMVRRGFRGILQYSYCMSI